MESMFVIAIIKNVFNWSLHIVQCFNKIKGFDRQVQVSFNKHDFMN